MRVEGLGCSTADESAIATSPPPPAPDEEGGAGVEGGRGRVERVAAGRGGVEAAGLGAPKAGME